MSTRFQIAVIGSGPSGLSCAAHAAELGLSHVLLEAEAHASNTIYRYQKGKHVMAEPAVLPLRSPLTFTAGKREVILEAWQRELEEHEVNIVHRARVVSVQGEKGAFTIKTAVGTVFEADNVVLCIGLQGNPNTLRVPGEDLPGVQYQLDDPDEYTDETIVVVGGGDAAIENAVALAAGNRVVMINRSDEFARAKQGNLDLVTDAIKQRRIECYFGTSTVSIERADTGGKPLKYVAQTPKGVETIPCDRVIARLGATPPRKLVEAMGVKFPSADPTTGPQVSATYESSVPGLYIIGALGGYPLIKQAMNQGYEVVEYIRGNPVEPADEPLLKEKFRDFRAASSVPEALELMRRNVPLLAEMSTLQLREVMLESELHVPREGDVIFNKNDYTNSFYSIVEGEVLVESRGNGESRDIPLGRGQYFGEIGLLSGRRRTATIRAGRNCVLLETPRRTVLKLIASLQAVRDEIDRTYLRRTIQSRIANPIAPENLEAMVEGSQVKTFAAGEVLFKEGDPADGLYFVRRGSLMITRRIGGKEVVLAYLAAGSYIGEMALLSDQPRTATVSASVKTETMLLPAARFKEVVAREPELRAALEARALDYLSRDAAREAQPDAGNLIEFLLGQGLGEATDVLLIDESLCIRCNNCEKACADSHDGTSRLDRVAGPTFANIHVPTSCRHCENPHCMKDCPPNAIHRGRTGEVFIDETCIGCGNCERNCPYGVIQLAAVDPKRQPPSLWAWLLTGLTREPGREQHRAKKDQIKKAVKCDMCAELPGGPACVSACPTGAAIRVSPEAFLDYTER